MTMKDNWLRERAHQKKSRDAQPAPLKGAALMAGQPVGEMWEMLQRETKRQAAIYTQALGDPKAITVETAPDEINLRVKDGRHVTIRIDRKSGALSEILRNRPGVERMGKPLIRLTINADGQLAFNYGLHASAGSLLRRLIG